MFVLRDDMPTNDELSRQSAIVNVVLYGQEPTTYMTKKAAAICGHPSINIVAQAKIQKSLDHILDIIDDDCDLADPKTIERLRTHLKAQRLGIGAHFVLPKKQSFILQQNIGSNAEASALPSSPANEVQFETAVASKVNIGEFEALCFENNTIFRYLRDGLFSTYMYQNLMYYLNATSTQELVGNETWQAHLALFISQVDFCEHATMQAFYKDSVMYLGIKYDTSFVPSYDVRSLEPQEPIDGQTSDGRMLKYYNDLDEKQTTTVPSNMIGIFLVFPFKNGHHIRPSGKIVHLRLKSYTTQKSSQLALVNLCNMYNSESGLESTANTMPLDDAIYHAVYAPTLKEQAIALLILRRLVGDTLHIGEERIALPTEMNVLSWSQITCKTEDQQLVLPVKITSEHHRYYLELVQDIAAASMDKLSAVLKCHRFFIPEMHISEVYEQLTTDAERYVLLTLVLQDYRIDAYHTARAKLRPVFVAPGSSTVDLEKYAGNNRRYTDFWMERGAKTVALGNVCPPHSCIDLYRFADPSLQKLAVSGDVTLDREQMASFIALMVY